MERQIYSNGTLCLFQVYNVRTQYTWVDFSLSLQKQKWMVIPWSPSVWSQVDKANPPSPKIWILWLSSAHAGWSLLWNALLPLLALPLLQGLVEKYWCCAKGGLSSRGSVLHSRGCWVQREWSQRTQALSCNIGNTGLITKNNANRLSGYHTDMPEQYGPWRGTPPSWGFSPA